MPARQLAADSPAQGRPQRHPARHAAKARRRAQYLDPLLQIKGADVLANNFRHAHAQRCRKILHGHRLQHSRRLEQFEEAAGQALHVARFVEVDGNTFFVSQFAEVGDVGGNNRHAELASQVSHPTRACGRRIGHDSNAGALEERRDPIFRDVASELDTGVIAEALRN